MKKPPRTPKSRLFDIAATQQGFFTTKQAERAGYADNIHPFHVKACNWVRERRGLYRLAQFPPSERPDLMLYFLWSRNRREVPQGVYSHQTALSLHDLSDLMPAKLHMTVPKSFRRSSPTPRALILRTGDIPREDIESFQGVAVTKPLRTLADLFVEGTVSVDHLRQGLREALARGLITRKELAAYPRLAPEARRELERLLKP